MDASPATAIPVDLPDWRQFQSNDDLRAIGLSERQIKMIWRRQGDVSVEVPKKDGTVRVCSGPNPSQKMLSRALYVYLLRQHKADPLWSDEVAYGFVPAQGPIDMAKAASRWLDSVQGESCVAYCDLKGAFGSVSIHGVRSALREAGLSGWNLELAVRLTTRPDELGRQVLTTGNPVSPAILNIACRDLDDRLSKLARGRNGIAQRFADDILVFGVGRKARSLRDQLLAVVRAAGFIPHPKKRGCTRTSAKSHARHYMAVEVVGVIVEQTRYRQRPDGAYTTRRMVSPSRFRDVIKAMAHRGSSMEDPRFSGRVRYARACRTWDRPRPEWSAEEAITRVEAQHRAWLAMRERRRKPDDLGSREAHPQSSMS